MIRVFYALRRNPEISCDRFRQHWSQQHAELVSRYHDVLRIVRYAQHDTLHGELGDRLRRFRGANSAYDGLAEICYESASSLSKLGREAEAREASRLLLEDERQFVDIGNSSIWIGEERVVFDGQR